ncbi:prevent-host-death protein [Frateuria terrea]|nr:prevent-host-death protein [Frateuria terrea]
MTPTDPFAWLDDALRQEILAALHPGESLQSFVTAAAQRQLAHRRCRREFLSRAIASSANAQQSGHYIPAGDVLARLEGILQSAANPLRPER